MAGFFDSIRQGLGNTIDVIGTYANLPELGFSEGVAGQGTVNTGGSGARNSGQAGPMGTIENLTRTAGHPSAAQVSGDAVPGSLVRTPLGGGNLPSGGGTGSTGLSQAQLQALSNTASQGINQEYQGTLGILNQNQAQLQGQLQDLVRQTGSTFDQSMTDVNSQKQLADKQLSRNQQDIDTNKERSLTDLTSNLRNQMESFVRLLGSYGAVDSSAASMGQYAFSQLGQQQRAQIQMQANDLYQEVNRKRDDVNTLYTQNINKLNMWKKNQIDAIENDWKLKNAQIQQAKAQADQDRLGQLNDLQLQIQQQAMNSAIQVDQKVKEFGQVNQQWAQSQAKSLADMQQTLNQAIAQIGSNISPLEVSNVDSSGLNGQLGFGAGDIQTRGNGGGFINALLPQNRKDDQRQV